jgi:molecular chaperone IbpA
MLLKEDVDMRTSDFAPLYRSMVGFDRLFERLGSNVRPDWPPYDIERVDENSYRITMALAGFSLEDIELTQQGSVLVVAGKKEAENGQRKGMLHQGLAFRSFRQSFNLADHLKVTGANLVNGMLTVDLVREIPEALQPRRIAIGTESPREPALEMATPAETNAPKAA